MKPRILVIPAAGAQRRRAGTQGHIFARDVWVPGLPRLRAGVARDDKRSVG
jgi:hypothetical protein